jgi:hypothetical protein
MTYTVDQFLNLKLLDTHEGCTSRRPQRPGIRFIQGLPGLVSERQSDRMNVSMSNTVVK